MRKFFALAAVAMMLLSLMACGGDGTADSDTEGAAGGNAAQSTQLSMEDIVWSVEESVIDGECYVLMSYTNNSPFVISGFEISFIEKDTISADERETYYSEIQEAFDFSDEDLADVKERKISMHTKTDKIVAAGETVSNINCYYYSGSYYLLKNLAHYNLVEPDIGTVRYIDDGRIYTVNYDFKSDRYTMDDETVEAYQWSATALGDHIPRPDAQVVEAGRDDEMIFMFEAYGMSLEQFNAYVEECKAQGYTIDVSSFEIFYTADNDEMYNIYLCYHESSDCMSGAIAAPEEVDTEDMIFSSEGVDERNASGAS